MLDAKSFRAEAHRLADWMADYLENVEKFPVKSQVLPRSIYNQLPLSAPMEEESMDAILKDFEKIILPGITHWQHPKFFAYFPANSSYASVLAEMITATIGAQCMLWDTSPAAAELEEKTMHWLRDLMGLPATFEGVIQDSASSATLAAILSARERFSNYQINADGFESFKNLRVYASTETHSSIEKAVKIAGFGKNNLVKVSADEKFRLNPEALETAIENDLKKGLQPVCVVATLGTTGTTAIDPLGAIARICSKHQIWLHVDAAFAGTALLLPEFRWMIEGAEAIDSFVFNVHKWMFTNFDCSIYFVKDKEALVKTFEILPEYLKTQAHGKVNNYCDWGVPLGRRFRALKLWFVLRSFGVEGIRKILREHLRLAKELSERISAHPDYEILAPLTVNLICFRFHPKDISDENRLNELNEKLIAELNRTGQLYLTHTKLNGKYTIRLCIGQTRVEQRHVDEAWALIQERAEPLV